MLGPTSVTGSRHGRYVRSNSVATRAMTERQWVHIPVVLDRIRMVWRAAELLKGWLETYVGPSDMPAR